MSTKLNQFQRLDKILELLVSEGPLFVSDVHERFSESGIAIRHVKDKFEKLRQDGYAIYDTREGNYRITENGRQFALTGYYKQSKHKTLDQRFRIAERIITPAISIAALIISLAPSKDVNDLSKRVKRLEEQLRQVKNEHVQSKLPQH